MTYFPLNRAFTIWYETETLFVTVIADYGNESDSEWRIDDVIAEESNLKKHQKEKATARILNEEAVFVPGKRPHSTRLKFEGHCLEKNGKSPDGQTAYWVCPFRPDKKQAKGCKVSAITRGFILEKVTGEHTNHTKKLKENDGRFRKNKKVAKTSASLQPDTSVEKGDNIVVHNIDATFLKGKRGGSILVDPEGYHYEKNSSGTPSSGLFYWRCRTHYSYGCRSRAITKGTTLMQTTGTHDHSGKVNIYYNYKKPPVPQAMAAVKLKIENVE